MTKHTTARIEAKILTPAAGQPQGGRSPLGGQRVTDRRSRAGANVGVVV